MEKQKRIPKRRFREFLEAGEWEEKTVKEVAPLQRGFDLPINLMKDGNYPVIASNGIIGYHNQYKAKGPGVVTGRSGTIGNLHYVEKDYWPHNTSLWVTDFKGNWAEFVYYLYTKLDLSKFGTGSGVPTLNRNDVHDTYVFAPSLPEQQHVSNFCRRLDTLISLHQQKLSKLKDLKQAYLTEMFPAPGEKRPRRRCKGFSGDWEKVVLGDIVNFLDGQRRPLEAGERKRGIYPYYGATGIIDYVDGYLFSGENILLSEDGANIIDRNYRVCFLADGKYWVNNHAHVMNAHSGYVNGFICEALERLDYTSYNTGTAQPKLNQDVCRKIELLVPSYDEQKNIYGFLNTIDVTVIQLKTKLAKLQSLKQAYLSELFV